MGVLLSSLGMSCKTNLLLIISVIVVQLHNTGVAGLPIHDWSSEAWYMTPDPAQLTTGHLTPGILTPGHLTPGILTPGYLIPRGNGNSDYWNKKLEGLMNRFKKSKHHYVNRH